MHLRSFVIPLGMAVAVAAALVSVTAANASDYDYKYCLNQQGGRDCDYSSYAQCETAGSGRTDDCEMNPSYVFSQPGAFAQ